MAFHSQDAPPVRNVSSIPVSKCISFNVITGHNRNVLNLAHEEWNLFWMFGVAASTEFPADILMILTIDRFGRRWMSFLTMSLSGICAFIAATVHQKAWIAEFVMAMLSRFWINVSFNIGLQYASELLPTVIRGQGVNAIHIIGYVAALVSPVIAQIGHHDPVLSLLLLGGLSLFGGILSLFLLETLGEDLPNNLEEAEAFGKNQSFWNCPICAKPKPVKEETTVLEPEPVIDVGEAGETGLDEEETKLKEEETKLKEEETKLKEKEKLEIENSLKWRKSLRSPIRGEEYRSSLVHPNDQDGGRSILMSLFS